jgi:hypothetical protein
MRKFISYSFIIFSYNILLLILPIIFFLISIGYSKPLFLDILPWIYCPFLLFSPLLLFSLGFQYFKHSNPPWCWTVPTIMSLIGYSPFIVVYLSFSSLWDLYDFLFLLGLPILLGLVTDLLCLIGLYLRGFFMKAKLS